MAFGLPSRRNVSSTSNSLSIAKTWPLIAAIGFLSLFFLAQVCLAQDQAPAAQPDDPQNSAGQQMRAGNQHVTITIPAGTRVALVLTQPVQSRSTRRGDDIYAQVTSPVDAGNEVAIPPGTFFQGQVDKVARQGGRGELRLQSASVTFPDGYVAAISGPVILETPDGYALRDPGPNRGATAMILPFVGAGVGALIGHSVGGSSSTLTSTLPPGCTGPPPGCLSSSTTVPGNSGRNAIIGAGIGGAIGAVTSFVVLGSSRHFFLDVGAPAEMTLQQPVTLQQDEVAKAVQQSGQSQVAMQPVAPRPVPLAPPPPVMPTNSGTCWTPGTPGTPPTTIPGAPGANGIPGPPTVIPGTPGTPPTPYPCP